MVMRRALTIILAAAMILAVGLTASAQETNEWGQFQKDTGNSGYLGVTAPSSGDVSKKTGNINAVDGSQPVVAGNRFYVYTSDGVEGAVECYELDSFQMVWKKRVDPPTVKFLASLSSPAVSGGVAYVGSGSKVYAFDAVDGNPLWTKDLAGLKAGATIVNSSPTVEGERLYIGDWDNGIYYCLDASNRGAVVWSHRLDAGCHAQSTPAVDGNKVFVGQFSDPAGTNGKVWCLNKADGKPVSSWGTNGRFTPVDRLDVTGSVTVAGDCIYFTDFTFGFADEPNSHLYCLEKETGREKWKTATYPASGTPAVGDGMVVTAGNQWNAWPDPSVNWVSAFSADSTAGGAATPLWNKSGFGGWNVSPAICDGSVLVGNFDTGTWTTNGVWCLDSSDGGVEWKNENQGGSSPVPTARGVLSVGGGGAVRLGEGSRPNGDFYFAEGTTREGYQEWLCLVNPTGKKIDAVIEYMLSGGTNREQPIELAPESRTTVDVNLFLGPDCDAAAHITGNGYFIAERSVYVDLPGLTGGEQVMGSTDPSTSYLFAEGTTRDGFQTWLALQNPNDQPVDAIITYLYGDGTPPAQENLSVGAKSRETVDVNLGAGPGKDVSIAVTSNRDIIGERVMYFTSPGEILGSQPTGVHNSTGVKRAMSSWYFAEGTTRYNFQEWLCLMNPEGEDTTARVTYMLSDGSTETADVPLAANSRTTIDVNAEIGEGHDVSVTVTSDDPVVAERPVYFQYDAGAGGALWGGGHDTAGAPYSAYRWEFAEGTTRNGYVTYLCLANPNNSDVEVTVDYIISMDDGTKETATETIEVKGNSRYTVDVNQAIGPEKDVSMVVTCDLPVVAERPMYFGGSPGGGTSLGLPGTL
jgi:outer membrane protein assembly factor BamB